MHIAARKEHPAAPLSSHDDRTKLITMLPTSYASVDQTTPALTDRPCYGIDMNVKWTRCRALDSGVVLLSRQAHLRNHKDFDLDFGSIFEFMFT